MTPDDGRPPPSTVSHTATAAATLAHPHPVTHTDIHPCLRRRLTAVSLSLALPPALPHLLLSSFVHDIYRAPWHRVSQQSGHRVSVTSAVLTATGFEYDRAWCVVDLEGTRFPQRESISQRKLPKMATVVPTFSADGATLHIDAPGMPRLSVPTAEADCEDPHPHPRHCSRSCMIATHFF